MNFPKITVITPSFNQGQFLEETILSVIEQNYPNLEYLIFDGGSTDNSVEIIKKYERYISFWVSEKDKGQTDAINKGFKQATGQIIAWLNSDDFYYPGALHLIAEMYNKYPEAGLYIGNGAVADKEGKRIRKYSEDILFDFDVLLKGSNYILQPSTFINNKAVHKVGYLDESLYYAMDLEYWLRVAKDFEVVTVNEELSAYRWYDEIKTKTGGIKRWVEQWGIMRRYSKAQLTPGLLVEFFNVLKEEEVNNDLGFKIENFANENWQKFYLIMQKLLDTNDCIPVKSNGKVFIKEGEKTEDKSKTNLETKHKDGKNIVKEKTNQINVIHSRGSNLKIDIVMPEGHSWFVREGYAEALKKFNVFGRAFYVSDKKNNSELFDYLRNPKSDMMFLMNTDWHAQYLHNVYDWQKRWNENKLIKILYSFECMNNPTIKGNNIWWRDNITAVENAVKSVNAIVYAHEIDEELFQKYHLPILWQPFAIDENLFPEPTPYLSRKQKAFFKGKTTPFYYENTYSKRRLIAQQLKAEEYCEIYEDYDWQSNQQFIEEMNEYQITLGLPSLSPTMVVRPFEAMGSGCVFFQNKVLGNKTNQLFEDGKNILLYDENNISGLLDKIKFVINNPDYGKQVAESGYKEVMEKHTIKNRVAEFLDWFEKDENNFKPIPRKNENKEYNLSITKNIAIDGIIFQLQKGRPYGISRVWLSLLNEISKTELANRIILFDRGETAPKIPGIKSIIIKEYDYINFESDSLYLEDICKENNIELFISTYFTYPENTHNVLMLHDMIPEILGLDLTHSEWRAKLKALSKANAYLSVSKNTLEDFKKLYPEYSDKKTYLVSNAVSDDFHLHSKEEIANFKMKFNIQKPYFVLVGNRLLYKNAILFFKAFAKLENKEEFEIFCTGGQGKMELIFQPYLANTKYQIQFLSDEELSIAYAGAIALVYPSKYEGFGLPILEAMNSGCPVITCKNSSIPEVAGEAAIFVNEDNVTDMIDALKEIQNEDLRKAMIKRGLEQAANFSWQRSATVLKSSIQEITDLMAGKELNLSDPLDTYERVEYSFRNDKKFMQVYNSIDKLKLLYKDNNKTQNSIFIEAEKFLAKIDDYTLSILNKLVTLNSTDGFIDYLVGMNYYLKNDKTTSLKLFLSAIKKNFLHWRVYYSTAKSAFDIGKLDEARTLLKKTLEQNPKCKEADALLKKIKTLKNEEFEVSAIVAAYNSEKFIDGCIKDLLEQTLYKKGELEIIVVNTGSQQNEESIVKKYQSKYKNIVYIKTEERKTIYEAWNLGIKASKGRYLTNANTDDRNKNDAFEIKASVLDMNTDVSVVYADDYKTTIANSTFVSAPKNETCIWANYDSDLLLFGCYIGPHPMWRKSIHEKYGYFNEELEVVGDYEFWLRISHQVKFLHIQEMLGLYFYSAQSAEHRNKALTDNEHSAVQKYYLCRYIESQSYLKRITEKIASFKNKPNLKSYYKSAFSLLSEREKGLKYEETLIVFIKELGKMEESVVNERINDKINEINSIGLMVDSDKYLELLYLYQGAICLRMENIQDARTSYENALQINNKSSQACMGLGNIFYLEQRLSEAKTMFDWAVKTDSQNQAAIEWQKKINIELGLSESHTSLLENLEVN